MNLGLPGRLRKRRLVQHHVGGTAGEAVVVDGIGLGATGKLLIPRWQIRIHRFERGQVLNLCRRWRKCRGGQQSQCQDMLRHLTLLDCGDRYGFNDIAHEPAIVPVRGIGLRHVRRIGASNYDRMVAHADRRNARFPPSRFVMRHWS